MPALRRYHGGRECAGKGNAGGEVGGEGISHLCEGTTIGEETGGAALKQATALAQARRAIESSLFIESAIFRSRIAGL